MRLNNSKKDEDRIGQNRVGLDKKKAEPVSGLSTGLVRHWQAANGWRQGPRADGRSRFTGQLTGQLGVVGNEGGACGLGQLVGPCDLANVGARYGNHPDLDL